MAICCYRQVGDFSSFFFEVSERIQHGLVLGSAADDVLSLTLIVLKYTLYGHVDGFRSSRRKGDFVWCSTDECSCCSLALSMAAAATRPARCVRLEALA